MKDYTEIYAVLTDVFHEVFARDDIVLSPELTAKDVEGWDSFKQIEIVVAVEDRFAIQLNVREIDSLRNVGDLVKVIADSS